MSTSGAQGAEETDETGTGPYSAVQKPLSVTGCGSFTGMTALTTHSFSLSLSLYLLTRSLSLYSLVLPLSLFTCSLSLSLYSLVPSLSLFTHSFVLSLSLSL